MSSITSVNAMPHFSPLSRLQNELASEVQSGAISTDDQSALSAALTDIDSQMRTQAPTDGSPPSRGDMKTKINNLIDGEVSAGKLTSTQADELKNVFSNAFKGGPGGPGGPNGSSGGDSDELASGTTTSTDSDIAQVMSDFLKLLQDLQGGSSSYSSKGDSLIAQVQSLIVNYQA